MKQTRTTPSMEDFQLGQWVIALEPRTVDTHVATNFEGETAIAQAVMDRSFTDHPYPIVAVDLPFVMLEVDSVNEHGKKRRVALNLREWKLKVCSTEFVEAWRATLP